MSKGNNNFLLCSSPKVCIGQNCPVKHCPGHPSFGGRWNLFSASMAGSQQLKDELTLAGLIMPLDQTPVPKSDDFPF